MKLTVSLWFTGFGAVAFYFLTVFSDSGLVVLYGAFFALSAFAFCMLLALSVDYWFHSRKAPDERENLRAKIVVLETLSEKILEQYMGSLKEREALQKELKELKAAKQEVKFEVSGSPCLGDVLKQEMEKKDNA